MLNKNDVGLSIIVPVYNESDSIASTLTRTFTICEMMDAKVEVIVVNDGSSDQTTVEVQKQKHEKLIVINHETNRGYGASLKTGLEHANYNYVCIIDADGTYPIEKIPELFNICKNGSYHMVVGSRVKHMRCIPMVRRPAKFLLNKLANYLSERKIPDLNSGMRVMDRDVVMRFIPILPNGFSFTTTITLSMLCNNYDVKYIPIDYYPRKGNSKIRPVRDSLNFIQLILRAILYFNPMKVFVPLSLGCLLMSFGLILYRVAFSHGFIVTSTVLFFTGMQLLGLGMLAELINKRLSTPCRSHEIERLCRKSMVTHDCVEENRATHV